MAGRNSSIHIATKVEVTSTFTLPDSEVSFPSAWFRSHPGIKPQILIPNYSGTPEDLIRSVKGGIASSNLTIETAKCFLHYYASNIQETLEARWVSYGVEIGAAQADINPWSLATIQLGPAYTPPEEMPAQTMATGAKSLIQQAENWSLRAMALLIVSVYRVVRVTNDEYRTNLATRIDKQLTAEGGNGITTAGADKVYGVWVNDRNYLKMIAVLDMFLHRFKDCEEGILRMGTLGSRFRDCAGLLSFGYAQSILKIKPGDLMDWIFIPEMGEEMLRLAAPNEESGEKESYFAYQSDLGLVSKSAYSSVANPYIFHWIHIIGALLGHKRSQNARFNFEGSYSDVGLNAVLLVWVFARGGELTPQFSEDGVNYGTTVEVVLGENEDNDRDLQDNTIWTETQGRSPQAWFALLKTRGFRVPKVVADSISRQRAKILDARADTIGDFVKRTLSY